jgi:SMODS-associated and fused to various effectors sensor domain/TIR domain
LTSEPPSSDPASAAAIDPLGPVFLSYRTSDGQEIARRLAWALRGAGAPVWHDVADLPPGDTALRLQEALAGGLSGAVLLITPDLELSRPVREIELPEILRLAERPDFTLVVASAVEREGGSGRLDLAAPDRLLGTAGELSRLRQYPLLGEGALESIAREIVLRRMVGCRALGSRELVLDLQTRAAPHARAARAGLVVRTLPPPPGLRAPSPEIWPPLRSFLRTVPELLEIAGVERLLVRGGAHLTAAFALGTALPSTCPWEVAIEDAEHAVWRSRSSGLGMRLRERRRELGARGLPVAVLVDLVPSPQPVDALGDLLASRPEAYSASVRISSAEARRLVAEEGAGVAREIAAGIRRAASRSDTHQVHLFLRTPFPLAVLIGRELNTLEITLYEWEDGAGRPRYIPTVTVGLGRGGGPILAVHGSA